MNMLVAYDIADPKRLYRIAKIMQDYGKRVQKSIFELNINPQAFKIMQARIEKTIVPEEDGVKYFSLCEKCAGTRETIGLGVFVEPDKEYYIV